MVNIYIASLITLGGLGVILAIGLGLAAKAFHIEKDERLELVENALPGVNCGACGYVGCAALAEAIVSGEAPVEGCPVGGSSTAQAIAEIMGTTATVGEREIAQVLCKGGLKETLTTVEYQGIQTCKAANMISGGTKSCQYGCLGLGDCAVACPFDAIIMNDNGLPEIDPDKCTGCGECVRACPRNIITMAPISKRTHIRCSSYDHGKVVRQICTVGCIGCGICSRVCPEDAIRMENNLAIIDYEKCTNCGLCAEKCPTGTIEYSEILIEAI
ncbi:MAG: RnfABCDGE type electron transport complex subunit B [Halanaerobiaceae bacterium]|nr:RnfABCDGE type electron transport complex subunit B [Halanaerobiaceae bacterium]